MNNDIGGLKEALDDAFKSDTIDFAEPRTTDAQVIELNEIRAIAERETDPVRALRRRFLTLAIDSAASSILHLRLMLSEADVDDLPVLDADSVVEPLAHIFYESSRLREQVARLATGRDHYFPFLLSKLDGHGQ